jgi:hypothetical protein
MRYQDVGAEPHVGGERVPQLGIVQDEAADELLIRDPLDLAIVTLLRATLWKH